MFVDHTVFYDIWSLKVSKTTEILTGSPIAPQPPTSASPPILGTTGLCKLSFSEDREETKSKRRYTLHFWKFLELEYKLSWLKYKISSLFFESFCKCQFLCSIFLFFWVNFPPLSGAWLHLRFFFSINQANSKLAFAAAFWSNLPMFLITCCCLFIVSIMFTWFGRQMGMQLVPMFFNWLFLTASELHT